MHSRFVLSAHDIRKSFGGVEVLRGVDLDVVGGKITALVGENGAGKSTLVRILAGDHQPDSGRIDIGDSANVRLDPVRARAAGIRMIFQEFTDAPTLTVSENISLGQWAPVPWRPINWSKLRKRAIEALERLGAVLDPDALVGTLRVGERQLVEIARALSGSARCLILDEPTAALSSVEVDRLFELVLRLREQGVAIVYITHRLTEVMALADDVIVLRDGAVTLQKPKSEVSRREIVTAMVGEDIGDTGRPANSAIRSRGPVRLLLKGACSPAAFEKLDLQVRGGEVVALYGKVGSGTAEVADVIFGRRQLVSGSLEIDGNFVRYSNPRAAIDSGVGYLPSDRQREGALMLRPAGENVAAPSWPRLSRLGVLKVTAERDAFRRWQEPLAIHGHGGDKQAMATFSGGNQQKVLLARWLERGSVVLALVEPTRGVDVGARQDIYNILRERAAAGAAIIVTTSDPEEVVQLADRAIVMARGSIVAELTGDEISTNRLVDAVS